MYLNQLKDIPVKEIAPGYFARYIHTQNMTLGYHVKAGCILKEHSHIHEQVPYLLEGRFQLTVDGNIIDLKPDKVMVIPSNVKHSGVAITDWKLLDVFNPVKEDYKF